MNITIYTRLERYIQDYQDMYNTLTIYTTPSRYIGHIQHYNDIYNTIRIYSDIYNTTTILYHDINDIYIYDDINDI